MRPSDNVKEKKFPWKKSVLIIAAKDIVLSATVIRYIMWACALDKGSIENFGRAEYSPKELLLLVELKTLTCLFGTRPTNT